MLGVHGNLSGSCDLCESWGQQHRCLLPSQSTVSLRAIDVLAKYCNGKLLHLHEDPSWRRDSMMDFSVRSVIGQYAASLHAPPPPSAMLNFEGTCLLDCLQAEDLQMPIDGRPVAGQNSGS